MTPALEARGLVKRFALRGGRAGAYLHAVDDVDLVLAPGGALGLVGESGCGKTTLARLLARLIEPDAGEIWLNGERIDAVPAGRFASSPQRRRIQMVFQDANDSFNPRFTAFESIADPVRALIRPASRAELGRRVAAAADQVGLPRTLLARLPHQLSGGEKARVGLARALAVEPKIIILDEPTSSLDVSIQATALKLLAKLRGEAGVALLFVSHDLNVVRLVCDRVAVMYLGEIVETGPAGAVFAEPRHPYTRALVAAIPRIGVAPAAAAAALAGEARSPIDPVSSACRLHGRCPEARSLCASAAPALRPVGERRAARCHFV